MRVVDKVKHFTFLLESKMEKSEEQSPEEELGELPSPHLIEDLKNTYILAYEVRNRLTKDCMNVMIPSKRHEYWRDIKELTEYFEDIHKQIKLLLDLKPECMYKPI